MPDGFGAALADAVQTVRTGRGVSVTALAEASGVSRAMIGKIERGEVQPTAALLARLAVALGVTLSELVARAEGEGQRVARHAAQPVWKDPATGYERRAVSPSTGSSLELVQAELPAGARVTYPAEIFRLAEQQIWVLAGHLRFHEGAQTHELDPGDCLHLGTPADCTFVNPGTQPCRYLVVLNKRAR
ncbi:helix-turn-helix domain-containing protein [Kineosporia corallincola]|uniref:helix-turn-helix domain-containing protein n=1 Tax=Kineosporia corallincola TaxID=2835133 RepID=UPI003555D43A